MAIAKTLQGTWCGDDKRVEDVSDKMGIEKAEWT